VLTLLQFWKGEGNIKVVFKPYLSMLPQDISTPLYWKESTLKLLKGSHIHKYYNDRSLGLHARFVELTQMGKLEEKFDFSLRDFLWAFSATMSRSFSLFIDGKETNGLVPFADFFNAPSKISEESPLEVKMENSSVYYTVKRFVNAGEELLVDYGLRAKDNTQLIMDYGYRMEGLEDYAVIFPKLDGIKEENQKLLKRYQLDSSFQITPKRFPFELLKCIRLMWADEDDLADEELVARMIKKSQPLSLSNERASVMRLCNMLETKLAEYQSDEDLAKVLEKETVLDEERVAVEQIQAEKRSLRKAYQVALNLNDRIHSEEL
jgi:hypothetical protein